MRTAFGIGSGAMTFRDGHVALLDDLAARAELGELTADEQAELVPALVARVNSAETRLDESRRARRLAEEAFGGRRRGEG